MPAPRAYLMALDGVDGVGYMRSALPPGYGVVHEISARDLACPACKAGPGEDCTTGRMSKGKKPVPLLCRERIELAREARDQGSMAVTEVRLSASCRRCSLYGGSPCEDHRCRSSPCMLAAQPGSAFCAAHGRGHRKMTPEKVEKLLELRAEGLTQPQIAARLGVSPQTVYNYLKSARNEEPVSSDGPGV